VIAFGGYNLDAAVAEWGSATNDPVTRQFITVMTSVTKAFHSHNFFAVADQSGLDARMSVSLDREGRYSVADLASAAKDSRLTFAVIEPRGIPIADQRMLKHLKMKVRAKSADAVDRIKEDLTVEGQTVEKTASDELVLTIRPRRVQQPANVRLPISGAEFAPFLGPMPEIRSDDKSVIDKAREIAGDDRDAWSVARKLSDWTYKNLKWRRVDYATAAQTLATRQADCLEFSQLFVAMARAVGLPARVVTGFAHSDNSFGGHAWVEVYAGRWVELDPTFGTDFVDATHIREATGDLIGYAALDLISIEVIDAPREVMDYQRDARQFAEKLVEEMAAGKETAAAAALDIAALVDERMGAGAWAQMSDGEREQMGRAYHRILTEMASGFRKEAYEQSGLRLLRVAETGDRAEALLIHPLGYRDTLLRIKLARKDGVWMLTELIKEETGFEVVADYLQPAVQAIAGARSGKQNGQPQPPSFLRALMLADQDDDSAVELIDEALKSDPGNRRLRLVKASALVSAEKEDEAVRLLTEMSGEETPFAPAIFKLADHYSASEKDEEKKKAIELYERYARLEPHDPRPHVALAELLGEGDAARGAQTLRAAIERDPRDTSNYVEMAYWLAAQRLYKDAIASLQEGSRYGRSRDELLADVLSNFYYKEETEAAEGLAAAAPEVMASSARANYYLGSMRMGAGRAREAVPLFKKAISISGKESYLHDALAECYRKLRNWTAALQAADAAIKIEKEDGTAHYHRACALARLGRRVEAMAALKLAVELDAEIDLEVDIKDEPDLKPLAAMREFKQLLASKEKDDR
jgi:tetratricopeptide (TPR) repeat protein